MRQLTGRTRAHGAGAGGHTRSVTVSATALITLLAASGCGVANGALLATPSARVTINGQDTETEYPIRCGQVQWMWTVETLPEAPGFTAMLETGGPVTARLVTIRDLGGFTGTAYQETVGDIDASIDGLTFTVSGTAHGSYADDPADSTSAEFRIEADC